MRLRDAKKLLDNPNFVKWFGKSAIVDEEGIPLRVYHGTNKSFDSFAGKTPQSKTGNPNAVLGDFFTNSPQEASRYAEAWGKEGGNVVPAYLSIKNPYPMAYKEFNDLAMGEYKLYKPGLSKEDLLKNAKKAREESLQRRNELIEEGYDGVVTRVGGQNEYIAFEPTQIKSAIGNRGAFDPSDPNILRGAAVATGLGASLYSPDAADAKKYKDMEKEQALEEPWFDPVNMALSAITGGGTLTMRAAQALLDPLMSYITSGSDE